METYLQIRIYNIYQHHQRAQYQPEEQNSEDLDNSKDYANVFRCAEDFEPGCDQGCDLFEGSVDLAGVGDAHVEGLDGRVGRIGETSAVGSRRYSRDNA